MQKTQALPDDFNHSQTLDDGLVLRLATHADVEDLCQFTEAVFYSNLAISVREMMTAREHGNFDCDFAIILDEGMGQIVSVAGLISMQWLYATQLLEVGLVEVVGTLEDYRGRGLSKKVIDYCYALSAAKGHHIQVVEGLTWYYRRFGYEYALAGLEEFSVPLSSLPPQIPSFQIRESQLSDIPQLLHLYQRQCADKLVTQFRDEDFFAYYISHQHQGALGLKFNTVLNENGSIIGYYGTWADKPYGAIILRELGVTEDNLYLPVFHAILSHMGNYISANRPLFGEEAPDEIILTIGKDHPATPFIQNDSTVFKAADWYIRVPDYVHFLRQIQAVLEKRLTHSALKGYSGKLNISFYTSGIALEFEKGHIIQIENWQPTTLAYRQAAFPFLTFSKLIFGYRSLAEIKHMYPDCRVDAERTEILDILFPKSDSWAIY